MSEMTGKRMCAYVTGVNQMMKGKEQSEGAASSVSGRNSKKGLGTGGGCLR